MRTMSLDEKITIKGKLARIGVLPPLLVRLEMKQAVFSWSICFRCSIADYAKMP